MRIGLLCAMALAALFTGAPDRPSPRMAAPEIIIFFGGPLPKPVAIASWNDNYRLLSSSEPSEPWIPGRRYADSTRPVIEMALFWGYWWRSYGESPERLATLTPARADQRGRYYPGIPGSRAMIVVGSINGPISDSGLAILERHGLPTQIK